MKKTLAFLLISIIAIASLTGCNIPNDNTPNNKKDNVVATESEISDNSLENTQTHPDPPTKSIMVNSLEELSQMREAAYCMDKEKSEASLLNWGCNTIEDLSLFLEVADSIPYIRIIDGKITWIYYTESIYSHKTLRLTTKAENGEWVRINYYLKIADAEDPISWATKTAINRGGEISEPMTNKDKRLMLISELRKKHPVYEGDCIEWWGTIDGIAIKILYYSTNIENIHIEDLLESLTISSIAEMDTVSHELIEQISEGMTYKEVKDILGTVGANTGSDSIVLKYYISDGRIAYIEFKENGASELNEFVVESIKVEKVE